MSRSSVLVLDVLLKSLVAVAVAVFAVLIATTMLSEPLVALVVVLLAVLASLGRPAVSERIPSPGNAELPWARV